MKIELHISYTKTIELKNDENIFYIKHKDQCIFPNDDNDPINIGIGFTKTFETENSAILDFIKWVDEEWEPFIHSERKSISQEKFNEWDEKCINFEKAIAAETGYNFKTEENEYTDECTIDAVLVNGSVYWEFGYAVH